MDTGCLSSNVPRKDQVDAHLAREQTRVHAALARQIGIATLSASLVQPARQSPAPRDDPNAFAPVRVSVYLWRNAESLAHDLYECVPASSEPTVDARLAAVIVSEPTVCR